MTTVQYNEHGVEKIPFRVKRNKRELICLASSMEQCLSKFTKCDVQEISHTEFIENYPFTDLYKV